MDIFGYILLIGLLVWVAKLSSRVSAMEGKKPAAPPPVTQAAVPSGAQAPAATTATTAAAQPAAHPVTSGPSAIERLIKWVQEDWLLKLGAGLLLIAFGWFVTYAFLNNWIGPVGRIALGVVAGTGILAFGWWRMGKYRHQGGIFMVLGSTVVLLTVYAARELYGFFNPGIALAVMFITTAFVALASVQRKSKALAVASIILAGVAPLLTDSPSPDFVALFAYLFVVVLGAIWIVVLTRWRELTTVALILVTFYSLPHFLSTQVADPGVLMLFAFAFATVFFFTNTLGILKSVSAAKKELTPDLLTAGGNGLFLLAWILNGGPEEYKSLLIAAWMIAFAVGAFLVFRFTKRHEPFYVYAGVGIAMLVAATAVELSGPILVIALIAEAVIIPLVAFFVLKSTAVAQRLSLLLLGPAIMAWQSIDSRSWRSGIIHDDFFVLLFVAAAFIGLGLFFWYRQLEEPEHKPTPLFPAYMIVGSLYAFMLIWLSAGAAFTRSNAVFFSLVVYTVVGLAIYFYGLGRESKVARIYGGLLLGVVVLRLILVDVWSMRVATRIVTFFAIGMLFISTAFISRFRQGHKKSSQTPTPPSPPTPAQT